MSDIASIREYPSEKMQPFQIGILTLFPEFFSVLQHYGVSARAARHGFLEISLENPRAFSGNHYQSVDDRPYGGGAGMVMRYEPLKRAHEKLLEKKEFKNAKTIYLSPQGQRLSQEIFKRCVCAQSPLILLCGRYEGIDERLIDSIVDEEWSIGDYILSGGELAAMVCIDAIARQLPGVLKNAQSLEEESFSNGLLEYPHYTKPRIIDGQEIPQILLSGNHEKIKRWRRQQSLGRTWQKRPELLLKQHLSKEDDCLLEAFKVEYLKSQSKNFVDS